MSEARIAQLGGYVVAQVSSGITRSSSSGELEPIEILNNTETCEGTKGSRQRNEFFTA